MSKAALGWGCEETGGNVGTTQVGHLQAVKGVEAVTTDACQAGGGVPVWTPAHLRRGVLGMEWALKSVASLDERLSWRLCFEAEQ